jgi:HEAT repeat protein
MDTGFLDEITYQGKPAGAWLAALGDHKAEVRQQAARLGSKIADLLQMQVPAMRRTLKDPSPIVRLESVSAFRALDREAGTMVQSIRAVLKEVALQDTDEEVRTAALEALAEILPQTKSRLSASVEALQDELAVVRFNAAMALADLGAEARPAIPALIHAHLWDQDAAVRVEAAVALWKIDRRDALAVPGLIKGLQHQNEFIRWIAADCLREMGPYARDAVPALREALRAEFRVALIRRGVALALARIDPQAAAEAGVQE